MLDFRLKTVKFRRYLHDKYLAIILPEIVEKTTEGGSKIAVLTAVARNFDKVIKNMLGRYTVISQVEICITTRCSLRCRDCANLIPYYGKESYDVNVDELLKNIKKFLSLVDQVDSFYVLGGEPLLYGDVVEIVKALLDNPKVRKVRMFTNGTVIAKDERLLRMFKNPRFEMLISDYSLDERAIKTEKYYQSNGVRVKRQVNWQWNNLGGTECRNRSQDELETQFARCLTRCYTILNGRIHRCPRSSHGMDLGIVPDCGVDYIDLNSDATNKVLRKMIRNYFYKKPRYIQACNYCDAGTDVCKKIDAGKQMR